MVNSNEKFLGKLCNKNIHEKLHIQENYTLKITHAGEITHAGSQDLASNR